MNKVTLVKEEFMTNPISGLGLQITPIAQVKPTNSAEKPASNQTANVDKVEDKSLRDQINEVGFRKYTENIREEKLKEIREKILNNMGLDEDTLANMSGEQRNNIEEMISREIAARMQAAKEMGKNESDDSRQNSSFTGIADSYQISSDGQRINATRAEKTEPLLFSFYA